MKAIVYLRYGSPDHLQLQEVEKPIPEKGEVLVKVYSASINSWDWDLIKGTPFLVRLIGRLFTPRHKILGADIAGTIEVTGDQVTDFRQVDVAEFAVR